MTLDDRESLTHTPTWAVAVVCVIFVVLSLLVERGIHKLGKALLKNKQKPLYEALQKMKEELMLLGFISLLLTVAQNPISKMCMPEAWADHMLPCDFPDAYGTRLGVIDATPAYSPTASQNVFHNRRLLFVNSIGTLIPFPDVQPHPIRRSLLPKGESQDHQCKEGYTPLFSPEDLHQLHIFIFVMAVVHVFYSCLTVLLGFTQLRSWRKWEEETRAENYDFIDGLRQSFKLERQNTFVTSRTSNPWCTSLFGSWVASFFRQFGNAVTKSDYLSLRMGFIKTHNASKKFNFHVYMMRTLEDDFKTVVGISGYLWIFVIIFLILNVHGWYAYFWISFIPILINVLIGTKLQHIITQLALEAAQSHIEIKVPIKLRDELFWFNRPNLLLYLIHFVLFQNAFELAFCLWILFTMGIHSCLIDKHGFILIRVVVGFLAQVLCSYSTLPLYALVTQMGSHYKRAIFDEPLKNAIYGWQSKAKESRRMRQKKSFEEERDNSMGQSTHSRFELLSEVSLFSDDNATPDSGNEQVPSTKANCQHKDSESVPVEHTDLEPLNQREETRGESLAVRVIHDVRKLRPCLSQSSSDNSAEKIKGRRVTSFAHLKSPCVRQLQPCSSKSTSDTSAEKSHIQTGTPLSHLKPPILDRSRSNVELSTRLPSSLPYEWSPDIDNMEIPLQPRKQGSLQPREERSFFERCTTTMGRMPRSQP